MKLSTAPAVGRTKDLIGLAVSVAVLFAVAGFSRVVTGRAIESGWYGELAKPAFTPPDAVFGAVWAVLFFMMAVAVWLVWRRPHGPGRRLALSLFAVQLVLNAGWSVIFFGLRAPTMAFLEILVLLPAIGMAGAAMARVDSRAGWLMVPYGLWVMFASVLNAWIALAN